MTNPASDTSNQRQRRGPRNYRRPPSVALPKARPVREDELLSDRWGCEPSTAHGRKLALPNLVADVIEVRRQLGSLESLARWLCPIEVALARQPDSALCPELQADRTDAHEDDAQSLYRANPCQDTARVLLRKRASERMASLDHDRAIAERWGLTL